MRLRDDPLLSDRDGRLLLAAQALDVVGAGVSMIALPWLVLDHGGTSTQAGLIFALSVFPYVVFGLPAGVIGDRHSRQKVMWVSHAVQAVVALVIPLWAFAGQPPLAIVLLAAFAIGTARVFVDAAVFGSIASLIGREHFTQGQATLSASWAFGYFAGPALGGVLIGLVGPAFALLAEAIGFLAAFVLILLIRRDLDAGRTGEEEREPTLAMMKEGLEVIWHRPRVRAYTWVSIAWNLGAAMSAALIVPLLRETLGLSSIQAGIVLGIGAVMGLIVPVFLGRLVDTQGSGRVTAGLALLSSGSILATAAAPGFLIVTVTNAVRSFTDFALISTVIGERQKGVPDRLQARVGISGRMIAVCAISGGGAIGAFLADVIGVRGVFVVSGLGVAIAVILTIPRILRLDRPDKEPTIELPRR